MSWVISFVVSVLSVALLEGSNMISVSSLRATKTWNLTWSANVSSMYPPSSPLRVFLGDKLNFTCPVNATSNIWIQEHIQQYTQCNCNATGMQNLTDCTPGTTTRQICHDEVLIAITSDSNILKSALSFSSGRTYYLISYSTGDRILAGYGSNIAGGECHQGFKMVLEVVSMATTTEPATTTTAATTTISSMGSQLISTDLLLPGKVNENYSPNVGSVGNLVNGAIATAITRVSLTLLITCTTLALSYYYV